MRKAFAVAAVTAALVLVLLGLDVRYAFEGHWSGLFCTGTRYVMPPELEPSTYREGLRNGYDGQFYRLMAHDPFLTRGYDRYIDAPAYRYRRILLPAMAWLVAVGNANFIDGAFVGVMLLFLFWGCYEWAREFQESGHSTWWGGTFVLIPGCLASLERMLVDLPLAALTIAILRAVRRQNRGGVWALGAACALTRETGALLPLAAAFQSFLRREYRNGLIYASSVIPAACWWAYLHFRLAVVRNENAVPHWVKFSWDWGILNRIVKPISYAPYPPFDRIAQMLDQVALLGCLAVILWSFWAAWTRRNEFRGKALALQSLLILASNRVAFWNSIIGYTRILAPAHVLVGSLAMQSLRKGPLMAFATFVLMTDLRLFAEAAWHVKAIVNGLLK